MDPPPKPSGAGHRAPATAPAPTATAAAPVDMNHMVVWISDKAGMSGAGSVISKETINSVVHSMSVGSSHFTHAQAAGEKVAKRIEKLMREMAQTPASAREAARNKIARKIADLDQSRPLTRSWIHVDMDAFFAQVSLLDRRDLDGRPVAIGSLQMISTSNYVARTFGVRSAMPGFIAIKLCPQLVFLPHDGKAYKEAARLSREIFADYDPHFEAGSLDEAYLDVTDYVRREMRRRRRHANDPTAHVPKRPKLEHDATTSSSIVPPVDEPNATHAHDEEDDEPLPSDSSLTAEDIALQGDLAFEVAAEIRARVLARTRLTCSAGIGCNRMVAKISTDFNKPNGQHAVPATASHIRAFMDQLTVRKIPGVGKVMERVLQALGIETCAQLREPEKAVFLYEAFSADTANWLLSAALGLASTQHATEEDTKRKSISTERTFGEISSWHGLETKLHELAAALAGDVTKARCGGGRNVTLKLKTVAFDLVTRSLTVDRFVRNKEDLARHGMALLREEVDRLIALQTKPIAAPVVSHASPRKPVAPVAAAATSSPAKPSPHSSNPRDGVLKLRLMGLRLSALKEEPSSDGKASGNQSTLLGFVKTGAAAAAVAPLQITNNPGVTPAPAASPSISKERPHPSDADITSFFAVTEPTDAMSNHSQLAAGFNTPRKTTPPAVAARPTLDRFFAKPSTAATAAASSTSTLLPLPVAVPALDTLDLTHDDDVLQQDDQEEQEEWFQEFMCQPLDEEDEPMLESSSSDAGPASHLADLQEPPTFATTVSSSAHPSVPAALAPPPPPIQAVSISAPAPASVSLACPVCGRILGNEVGNLELNRHIDACLSGGGAASSTSSKDKQPRSTKRKHAMAASHAAPTRGMQTLDQVLSKKQQRPSQPQPGSRLLANTAANPINLD